MNTNAVDNTCVCCGEIIPEGRTSARVENKPETPVAVE